MVDAYGARPPRLGGGAIDAVPLGAPAASVAWVPVAEGMPLFSIRSIVAMSCVLLASRGLLAWAIPGRRDGKLLGAIRTGLANLFSHFDSVDSEVADVLPFGSVSQVPEQASSTPGSVVADNALAIICTLVLLIGIANVGRSLLGVANPSEIMRRRVRFKIVVFLVLASFMLNSFVDVFAAVFIYGEDLRFDFITKMSLCIGLITVFLFWVSRDVPNQLCTITVRGLNAFYSAECALRFSMQAHIVKSSAMQNLIGKVQDYGGEVCTELNVFCKSHYAELAQAKKGGNQYERGWDSAIDTKRFAEVQGKVTASISDVQRHLKSWLFKKIDADVLVEFCRPGLVVFDVLAVNVSMAEEFREEMQSVHRILERQAEGGVQLELETAKAPLVSQKMRARDDGPLAFLSPIQSQAVLGRVSVPCEGAGVEKLTQEIVELLGAENEVTGSADDYKTLCSILGTDTSRFIKAMERVGGIVNQKNVRTALGGASEQPKLES
jgi:hypothetical protein